MSGLAGQHGDVLLVGNPISGRGKVARHLDGVAEAVRALGLDVRVLESSGPGDAREAARNFSGGVILSFGGDGTFNEVLNGADLDRCLLGIIPAGAGNVFAKELDVPGNPLGAVGALAAGKTARLDLGVCNGRRFISMVGAGMDAHIVRTIHRARRGHLTQWHYVPAMLRQVFLCTRWAIQVEVDGGLFLEDADVVCVGNAHSYGGPVELTPMATPTDGLLDVMALRSRNAGDMLGPGLASLLRSLHAFPGACYGRGRVVRLSSTRDDVPWQVDGDAGGRLPAELTCEPARVRMLVPRGFRGLAMRGRSWA